METTRILRRSELLTVLGISRSTLYLWMANKQFPRPLLLGKRAVGWPSTAVSDWIASREFAKGWQAV